MTLTATFNATYRLLTAPPARLFYGEFLLLDVEIHNTGLAPWLTSGTMPVRLGYRWVGPDGAISDGGRAELPAPVPPGTRARVELWVLPPPGPGRYQLQVELVEEGRAWFGQSGVAPSTCEIVYAESDGPRVAIINGNVLANDAVGGHVVAQMLALREAGYHTMVITEFVDSRLPADVRRSIIVANLDELRDPQTGNAAGPHLRQSDIVIVNYSTYYRLAELIREVRRGVVIFDYHGVTPPHLWGKAWPGYEDLVKGTANLNLVRFADYAVGHSRYTADELIATGQIAPGRVAVMPYAVVQQAGYAGPPDPEIVARYDLAGKHVLLYVGRIARNKRVIDLVEAMATIVAHHPDTLLLVVGADNEPAYRGYAAEVKARAVELGIAAQVIFTGQVDDTTLDNLYRACAIFVTASIHEGFCMPVVEAMSRGRPVVAADITATPYTLGGAGLLFPPEDPSALAAQVCRLLDDLPAPGEPASALPCHQVAPASPAEIAALHTRKIGIVTPRYGARVLGGAESGMRSWAEQLAARGHRVEVLTTCIVDLGDWNDQLEPGVEELNGVIVRRFRGGPLDPLTFHHMIQKVNRGERLRYAEEQRFMADNLRSGELEAYLREHADEYAGLICSPYLFGTTYWTIANVPERALVVPCLHDEPSARLALFREMLERAAGIFYNAEAEGALASAGLGVASPYHTTLGYGFPDQPPAGDADSFRARRGIDGPLLLYSGRLEQPKNVPQLIAWFTRYKAERPGPLVLALAGKGDVPLPDRPDIVALGMLSGQELYDAYAACTALCQLSLNESFSIVIMEAWQQGRPAIVHADCPVTREHVERSGGGYAPGSYAQFRDALDALLADQAHADRLGICGRDYVQQHYSWSSLLPRIEAAIAAYGRPRSLYARLAQRSVVRALSFTRNHFADATLELVARAEADLPAALVVARREDLRRGAAVAPAGYQIRSGLPVVGRAVAWVRRQLTSHLKEPYLDPMIAGQDRFNRELLETLLPALDESLREQRRLRAEVELLRAQLTDRRPASDE